MLDLTKMLHIEEAKNKKPVKMKNSAQANSWEHSFEDLLETHSKQGLYLKGLRLRENYTQAQLGKLVGISQANISSMEKGTRQIGKNASKRFAAVFKVEYQNFL